MKIDLTDAFSLSMNAGNMSDDDHAALIAQIPDALAEEAPALAHAKAKSDALTDELKAARDAMEEEFKAKHADLITTYEIAKKEKDERELRARLLLQSYTKAGGEGKSLAGVFSIDSHVSVDDGAYTEKTLIEWIVTHAPFLAAGLLSVNKSKLEKLITLISTNDTDELGRGYRAINPLFDGIPVYPRIKPTPKIEWKKLAQEYPPTDEA